MAVTDSTLQQAWTPEDYGKLVDLVLAEKSIAFRAGTVVRTESETIRFPMLTADPAVAWTAENTQISLTDPTTNELVVTPKKVAGLTQISNEAASDSNPAVADQIGRGLARSVAKKVDAAFFGNTVTNGPSGLLSLSGVNVVDTGTVTLDSLDPFHEAKAAALADGAELWVFILAPDVALTLSKAKSSTPDRTSVCSPNGGGRNFARRRPCARQPRRCSRQCVGPDGSQVLVVQRTGTKVVGSTRLGVRLRRCAGSCYRPRFVRVREPGWRGAAARRSVIATGTIER